MVQGTCFLAHQSTHRKCWKCAECSEIYKLCINWDINTTPRGMAVKIRVTRMKIYSAKGVFPRSWFAGTEKKWRRHKLESSTGILKFVDESRRRTIYCASLDLRVFGSLSKILQLSYKINHYYKWDLKCSPCEATEEIMEQSKVSTVIHSQLPEVTSLGYAYMAIVSG